MFSIQHKFLLCKSLTVLLAVLLLGSLSYWLMVDALKAAQKEHLEFVARDTAREIEAYLAGQKELLQRIETTEYYQRKGDLPLAKYFSKFQESFQALTYLNQEGQEVFSLVGGRVTELPAHWVSPELFRAAMAQPNTVLLSPLQHSRELGQPVVWAVYAHQLYFGDQFVGALAGAIPLDKITARYAGVQIGQGGSISLIGRQAVVLDHPRQEGFFQPASISGPDATQFLSNCHRLKPGFGRFTLFGVDAFVAYAPIPALNCEVLVSLPRAEFMAAPNRLRLYSLLISLGVLAAGVAMSSILVRRLTAHLGEISRHTGLVAAGDLESRLDISSGDEIEGLARDFNAMTEQLQSANRDRETQHAILQSIIDPLIVTDPAGLVIQANPAAGKFLGYAAWELLGQPLSALFAAEEKLIPPQGMAGLLASGGVRDHETRARTRDGRLIPVLFSCAPTGGAPDKASGLVGIFKDISDRKQAEQARALALAEVEAARERLDAILKSVADGLLVIDLDQKIVLMNRAAETLLGLSLTTALNQPVAEVVQDPGLREHLLAAATPGVSATPTDLTARDGQTLIQARSSRVANPKGERTGVITLLRDVTQERQLDRMKNEFISTAAHELRTPLTSVMGYAELLISPESFGEFSPAERQDFLREIYAKSVVLAQIISDLLDVSRIESGQPIPLQTRVNDLAQSLVKVVRHFERHSPRHHFVLELPEPPDLLLCCDPDRVVQVLENLLGNAVKYAPGGGVVRVSLEKRAEVVEISVQDQGIGMSQEQVSRIFDKFYRADASDTAVGGLGLGMSIVRSLVAAHGGEIWVESAPGEGTSVYFTLPLSAPAAANAFFP